MIFVDTGAWYAVCVPSDPDHTAAAQFVAQNREPLVTSDYVVDELLTLLMVRGHKSRAIDWLRDILDAGVVTLSRVEPVDFESARRISERFADKEWSFTDCTSYAVMQRMGILTAFAFDELFRQFGICGVVP